MREGFDLAAQNKISFASPTPSGLTGGQAKTLACRSNPFVQQFQATTHKG